MSATEPTVHPLVAFKHQLDQRAEAEANIAAALDWLIEVGSADDEPAIKAGSMSIDEEGTDDDDAE